MSRSARAEWGFEENGETKYSAEEEGRTIRPRSLRNDRRTRSANDKDFVEKNDISSIKFGVEKVSPRLKTLDGYYVYYILSNMFLYPTSFFAFSWYGISLGLSWVYILWSSFLSSILLAILLVALAAPCLDYGYPLHVISVNAMGKCINIIFKFLIMISCGIFFAFVMEGAIQATIVMLTKLHLFDETIHASEMNINGYGDNQSTVWDDIITLPYLRDLVLDWRAQNDENTNKEDEQYSSNSLLASDVHTLFSLVCGAVVAFIIYITTNCFLRSLFYHSLTSSIMLAMYLGYLFYIMFNIEIKGSMIDLQYYADVEYEQYSPMVKVAFLTAAGLALFLAFHTVGFCDFAKQVEKRRSMILTSFITIPIINTLATFIGLVLIAGYHDILNPYSERLIDTEESGKITGSGDSKVNYFKDIFASDERIPTALTIATTICFLSSSIYIAAVSILQPATVVLSSIFSCWNGSKILPSLLILLLYLFFWAILFVPNFAYEALQFTARILGALYTPFFALILCGLNHFKLEGLLEIAIITNPKQMASKAAVSLITLSSAYILYAGLSIGFEELLKESRDETNTNTTKDQINTFLSSEILEDYITNIIIIPLFFFSYLLYYILLKPFQLCFSSQKSSKKIKKNKNKEKNNNTRKASSRSEVLSQTVEPSAPPPPAVEAYPCPYYYDGMPSEIVDVLTDPVVHPKQKRGLHVR